MTLYSVALFLHIVGAVILFVTLTAEGISVRFGGPAVSINRVIGPISALLILVPGLYMVATTWGWKPWVLVGIVSWLAIAVMGTVKGVRATRSGAGGGSAASWWARLGLAAGVLFLMTAKPDLVGSIVSVLIGAAMGWGISLAAGRVRRPRQLSRPA